MPPGCGHPAAPLFVRLRNDPLASLFSCPCDHCDLHSFPTRRSSDLGRTPARAGPTARASVGSGRAVRARGPDPTDARARSEEHTSELQSHSEIVCRLLLEKKNTLPALLEPPRVKNDRSTTRTTEMNW